MNNQQFERLVHNLQDIMRCPHCSAKYDMDDIHYLGQLDSMTFLHMRCNKCHTPVFASVALTDREGEIIPADITATDVSISDSVGEEPEDFGFEQHVMESDPDLCALKEIPVEKISADKLMTSLTPVAYDDVLDIHEYLRKFEGDFEKLLGAK